MIRRSRARSSSLFLMELILAILFFAIAAAVCLNIFAGAHKMSRKAFLLNKGSAECASVAEILQSVDSADEFDRIMQDIYGDALVREFTISDSLEMPLLYDTENENTDHTDSGTASRTYTYEETITVFFDKEFRPCEETDADSVLCCYLEEIPHGVGIMLTSEILVTSNGEEIYSLPVKHYVSGKEAVHE